MSSRTLPIDSRYPLSHLPTPLEVLARLSAELKRDGLWIKRDDCTGLATGGNKTRKLEYLIADAVAAGADCVITYGAVQSNHARQTAAACARAGLECHLVLGTIVQWPDAGYQRSGNILLDRLFGARIHLTKPDALMQTASDLIAGLRGEGRTVYVIPPGGSNAVGSLGYAQCAVELLQQSSAAGFVPDLVVHASSSGGTQAGLLAGFAWAGAATRVLGINVGDPNHAQMAQRIADIARETAARLAPAVEVSSQPWISHDYYGSYGIPTDLAIEAIRRLALTEAILLDPVYSGKGMAGFLDLLKRGALDDYRNIVFLHTGGSAVLSVYADAF